LPGSAGRLTGINITNIIDGLINHYEDIRSQSESLKDEHSSLCAINALGALKQLLEQHNLAALVPAAEVDQLHGENLVLQMRLDKAKELLIRTRGYISPVQVSKEDWNLYDEVGEFCYRDADDHAILIANCSDADVTELKHQWIGNLPACDRAEVNYDPKSGTETARTALENVLHTVVKIEEAAEKIYEPKRTIVAQNTCRQIKILIEHELKKLEEK